MSTTTEKGLVHSWPRGYSPWNTDMDGDLKMLNAWALLAWANNVATTTSLTYGYHGGPLYTGGAFSMIADGTIALSDNATNYVERTTGGSVSKNTAGFTAGRVPLAKVTTLSGAITAIEDWRAGGATDAVALIAALGTGAALVTDTDVTLAANSDANVATQRAVRQFVLSQIAGLAWKQSVRAATTANGTLATAFANGQTIDGVALVTGDRILLKNQTTGSENGIYTVNAGGAPTRATDADTAVEIRQASMYVEEGTVNADTQWVLTTNAPITLGTTALVFTQFQSGGGETNTASNLGGGSQLFKSKVGVDLQFRSLVAGSNITLTQNANDITIDATGGGGGPSYTVPTLSQFTNITSGATVADTATGIVISGSNNQNTDYVRTAGLSTPWSIVIGMSGYLGYENYNGLFLHLRAGASGATIYFGLQHNSQLILVINRHDAAGAFVSQPYNHDAGNQGLIDVALLFLKVSDDGTTRRYYVGPDPVYFGNPVFSEARATHATVDRGGFGSFGSTNTPPAGKVFHYAEGT